MLEWTVDRNDPFKAYKMLDLASGNYNCANTVLQCMTSAVVRNQIANSTIDHILKNRKALRDTIMKEMATVVSGWGIHLSTVEITDVKISSSSLFKDMQSKFREENNKKAELERMAVGNVIYFDKLEKDLEQRKRQADQILTTAKAQFVDDLKIAKREV